MKAILASSMIFGAALLTNGNSADQTAFHSSELKQMDSAISGSGLKPFDDYLSSFADDALVVEKE